MRRKETRIDVQTTSILKATLLFALLANMAPADGPAQRSVAERFRSQQGSEVPDFQKHVSPLIGRLGCNGRACHGSFQGRGGFQLSLFGYDFKADHAAMMDGRIDLDSPAESLVLTKPTNADSHEGGLRYESGSWQYYLLRRWIEAGAPRRRTRKEFRQPADPKVLMTSATDIQRLVKLDVQPAELVFQNDGQKTQLRAIAIWEDGTQEDVTPLCRFETNNDTIAEISGGGVVTARSSGDSHVVVFYDSAVQPVPVMQPATKLVGERYPHAPAPTRIDELVVQKLRKLGIVPSKLSTDMAFLRRVRLDMTGTLPTEQEVRAFVADTDPEKRAKKINQLLETPGYAAWWTTKMCDFTGNDLHQLLDASPFGLQAGQDCYDWVYRRVENNTPYDEIVAGIATATGIKPGQSYREYCEEMSEVHRNPKTEFADLDRMPYYWSRRDFREVETRAISFAYAFMGMRIQCAQCHKHPFDEWSKDDFHQFKNFFSRIASRYNGPPEQRSDYDQMLADLGVPKGRSVKFLRQRIRPVLMEGKTIPFPAVYITNEIQRTGNAAGDYPEFDFARLPGGDVVDIMAHDDPRTVLMDWLRSPDNDFFAKALVNRVWAAYFNAGIVDPPDDLSRANPPSNKPLLDYLSRAFIESGFDMKWLHRTITNSRTYQLSWIPNKTNRSDHRNFSHAIPRRLPAEVAFDAFKLATASDKQVAALHSSRQDRVIALATGPDNNNRNRTPHYAMRVFGRSTRSSNCDCDRSMDTSLLQSVFTQNDQDIWRLIDSRNGWLTQVVAELRAKQTTLEMVIERSYLRSLSRMPSKSELKLALKYIESASDQRSGIRDVLWALLNTKEFIVNH